MGEYGQLELSSSQTLVVLKLLRLHVGVFFAPSEPGPFGADGPAGNLLVTERWSKRRLKVRDLRPTLRQ